MSIKYPYLGDALRKMYLAEIGMLICAVCIVIPVINIIAAIAALACGIFYLVGLHAAGEEVEGCATAFKLQIAAMIVGVLASVFSASVFLSQICLITKAVLAFLVTYYIVKSITVIAEEIYAENIIKIGKITMVALIAYTAVSIVSGVISANYESSCSPSMESIYIASAVVSIICTLIYGILFLVFLRKASTDL